MSVATNVEFKPAPSTPFVVDYNPGTGFSLSDTVLQQLRNDTNRNAWSKMEKNVEIFSEPNIKSDTILLAACLKRPNDVILDPSRTIAENIFHDSLSPLVTSTDSWSDLLTVQALLRIYNRFSSKPVDVGSKEFAEFVTTFYTLGSGNDHKWKFESQQANELFAQKDYTPQDIASQINGNNMDPRFALVLNTLVLSLVKTDRGIY